MSDSSDKMITGGNDMLVKVWDLQRECIVDRLKGHTGWLWNVKSLDPELNVAMSSSTDGFCRKWDIRAGQCVGEINVSAHGPGKVFPVTGVALRGNGWHMAVGSLDKSVYVLDCRMMKRLYCIGKHEDRVCRAMMHEDTLMTTGWDHTVRLWEFN
jgi:WD40 repeat protein